MASCGLRSLSTSDALHNDSAAFRGATHAPINYLLLHALRTTYGADQHMALAGHKMSVDLVECVRKEFKRTQFLWERFAGTAGAGAHPHTAATVMLLTLARK